MTIENSTKRPGCPPSETGAAIGQTEQAGPAARAPRPPNIIFILSDQHRRDWMGGAGCEWVITPHLDRLAARGVRFAAAYCTAPLCGPSRMSLLTGRHPFRNGVYINEDCLDSNAPTFAHTLGLAGYETVLCGRMHMTGLDQRHGFEKRLVGDICRTLTGGRAVDYGPLAKTASNLAKAVSLAGPGDSPVLRYDEDVTRAFERLVGERQDSRPLFATVGWYGPHHPYTAPRELFEEACTRLEKSGDQPIQRRLEHPWLESFAKRQLPVPDPGRSRIVRANYAAMISLMDQRIGRILAAAERLPGETVVIYGSDHGEMAMDRGLCGKGCFFESSVGVPLIFSPLQGGSGWASNAVVQSPVSLADLAPTFSALGGGPALPQTDGFDLTPLLINPRDDSGGWSNRAVFSELAVCYDPSRPMRMIRRGRHKLACFNGYPPLLTDLEADPEEQVNLADHPAQAAIQAELNAALRADWDGDWIEREARERLRNVQFIQRFDRQTNPGDWHEAWNPARPVYQFGRSGEPLSWL